MKGFNDFLILGFSLFLASFMFLSCGTRKGTKVDWIQTADGIEAPIPLSDEDKRRSSEQPLKIFLMVGQSNMMGEGYINREDADGRFLNGTLEWMVESFPETYGKLKTYDETRGTTWNERDDVWITYNRQRVEDVRPVSNQHGPLIPGYGGGPGEDSDMGPELGFGWTVGDAMKTHNENGESDESIDILLVKIAWGGRDLAINYRPPSSGGDTGTGLYYEAMLADVYMTISKLSDLVPGYTHHRGYEIVGFAWHQGWNDGCSPEMTAEYETNLANLIRDVRTDLGIPGLPVVVGVSGMNGWHPKDPTRTALAEAQLAVANATKYPEFENNVASVETRDFYRAAIPYSPGDQIYHWNNNCESYWLIGQAMGEAMVDLVLRRKAPQGHTKSNNIHNANEKENRNGGYEHWLRGIKNGESSTIE